MILASVSIAATATVLIISLRPSSSPREADATSDHAVRTTSTLEGGLGSEPPSEISGSLRMSGDVEGEFIVKPSATRLRDDGVLWLESETSDRLLMQAGAAGTQIELASLRGHNFFPDSESCVFGPGRANEETGLVVTAIECPDMADVQASVIVSLQGDVALPLRLVFADGRYEGGGVLTVFGELQRDVPFVRSTWLVFPEARLHQPRGGSVGSFSLDGKNPGDSVTITELKDGELQVVSLEFDGKEFSPSLNDCSVNTSSLRLVAPGVEQIEIDISCANVESVESDATVGVRGSVVVDRTEIVPES